MPWRRMPPLRDQDSTLPSEAAKFLKSSMATPLGFIASPIAHDGMTSGISEACFVGGGEESGTSPRERLGVKHSVSLQLSGLRVSQPSERERGKKIGDRSLRVDELERPTSPMESEIRVEEGLAGESETTLNIYEEGGTDTSTGGGGHRLPRWDETSAETYSALKGLLEERAKSEVEVQRVRGKKDILFVHKQDAMRAAKHFKRTVATLLDGHKHKFGDECDSQLRAKCRSPLRSVSGAPTISASRYSSVAKEEDSGQWQQQEEQEQGPNPLQVESVADLPAQAFRGERRIIPETPRTEKAMSYRELDELRSSTARQSFKTPTFELRGGASSRLLRHAGSLGGTQKSVELAQEIDLLKNNERALRESLEALEQQKRRERDHLERRLEASEERVEDLESKLARAKRTSQQQQGDSEQVRMVEGQLREQEAQLVGLRRERGQQDRRIRELALLLEERALEIGKLQDEHERTELGLRERQVAMEAEARLTKERVSALQTKLEVALHEKEIKENEIATLRARAEAPNLEQLKAEIREELAQEMEAGLIAKLQELDQAVRLDEQEKLRGDYEKLSQAKNAIFEEIASYKDQIEALKHQTPDDSLVRAELEVQYQERVREIEGDRMALQSQLESSEREREALRRAMEEQARTVEEKMRKMQDETEKRTAKLEEKLERKRAKLRAARESFSKEKENLDSNLKQVLEVTQKDRVQAQLKSLDESRYIQTIETLKSNERRMEQQHRSMVQETASMRERWDQLETERGQLQSAVEALRSEKEGLERSVAEFNQSAVSTRDELSRHEEAEQRWAEQEQRYQQELQEKEDRIAQMERLLRQQRAVAEEMQFVLKKEKQMTANREERESKATRDAEQRASVLQEQVATLQHAKDQATAQLNSAIEELQREQEARVDAEQEVDALREELDEIRRGVQENRSLREEKAGLMNELEAKNSKCLNDYFEMFASGRVEDCWLSEEAPVKEGA